jgi:hypothetical protein
MVSCLVEIASADMVLPASRVTGTALDNPGKIQKQQQSSSAAKGSSPWTGAFVSHPARTTAMHDMQGDPIVFGFGLGGLRHKGLDFVVDHFSFQVFEDLSRRPSFSSRRAAGLFRKALS